MKAYLETLFGDPGYRQKWEESELERGNQIELARWIPFRRVEEQSVVERMQHEKLLRKPLPELLLGISAAWLDVATYTGKCEVAVRGGQGGDVIPAVSVAELEEDLAKLEQWYERPCRELRDVAYHYVVPKTGVPEWPSHPDAAVAGYAPGKELAMAQPPPSDFEEEFKRRGIDIWNLTPEQVDTLSESDIEILNEWRLNERGDPRESCCYPMK